MPRILLRVFLGLALELIAVSAVAQDNWGDVGGVAVDGLNASAISLAIAKAIGREGARPFSEWPSKAYLVFFTQGNEFVDIFYPLAAKNQVRVEKTWKDTRKGRKWSLEIWQGNRRVRTEGCAWRGDQVIGVFLADISGNRGEQFKQWVCAARAPDEEFYSVCRQQDGWADIVPHPDPSLDAGEP